MIYVGVKRMVKSRESEAALTRGRLVATARKLFAQGGQAAVGVIEVSQAAGVTTGALYHHFKKRHDLLRAVLDDIAGSVAVKALEAIDGVDDPWQRLTIGITSVLDACLEPDVKNAYNEAPGILGLDEWRALEESKTGKQLTLALKALADAGHLKPVSVELLAAMVKGAVVAAAMSITQAKHPKQMRKEAGELVLNMLSGLRVAVPRGH